MEDYYQKHYKTYYAQTSVVDPSSFLSPLIKFLCPGSTILDLGCGSGRDMLWLKNRGYKVIGLELSTGLAELAREHSGLEVIEADFETYDPTNLNADAFILVGSLVHIHHARIPALLARLTSKLKVRGKVFLTLKEGLGSSDDRFGRTFFYWRDEDLRHIFAEIGLKVLDFRRQISMIRKNDVWLGYVLEKRALIADN